MARKPRNTGFEQVLAGVERQQETVTTRGHGSPTVTRPLILDSTGFSSVHGKATSAYQKEDRPVQTPAHPGPATNEAIAAALGSLDGLDTVALGQLRRSFAQKNHPDMFAPQHRDIANARMTIANTAIDAAMSRLNTK